MTGPVQARIDERMRVMELLLGVGVLAAAIVAVLLMLKLGFWLLFAVVLPLAWLWMLVDAVLRREDEYPSEDTVEKVVWIVLMVFLQPSAIAYYFLVYRKRTRGELAAPAVG